MPIFVRLQILKGICVGRASRLAQSDIRPQARRPRYISEALKQTAVGIIGHLPFPDDAFVGLIRNISIFGYTTGREVNSEECGAFGNRLS